MDTRTAGRKGGRAKSLRKTEACRLNGLRNKAAAGRPPTKGWHLVSRDSRWAILQAEGHERVLAVYGYSDIPEDPWLYKMEPGVEFNYKAMLQLDSGRIPQGFHRLRWGQKLKGILHAVAWA